MLAPAVAGAALLAGCGGSEQTAHEVKATFPVAVVKASFPRVQAISRATQLVLAVRNTGARTMPNVAVTVDSFSYTSSYPGLADSKRPVWIVDEGPTVPGVSPKRLVQSQKIDAPGGGQTAFVNTWALGSLAPGATKTFVWHVTPVKAGVHAVSYVVAAGLNGNARARVSRAGALSGEGGASLGRFTVAIAPRPPQRYVNPETGKVTLGRYHPASYAR